jgi:hypothetical protein
MEWNPYQKLAPAARGLYVGVPRRRPHSELLLGAGTGVRRGRAPGASAARALVRGDGVAEAINCLGRREQVDLGIGHDQAIGEELREIAHNPFAGPGVAIAEALEIAD